MCDELDAVEDRRAAGEEAERRNREVLDQRHACRLIKTQCEICEEELPIFRQQARYWQCVDCQTAAERRSYMRRKP